jgi:hypothetical protein
MCWINQIKTIPGYALEEAIRSAENRMFWMEFIANDI